ncbi:TPA: prepilin peptidase [Vibrio parahaemolyticus]|nr:prepilin peptidase [Vibrio parahaemolyticus]
MLLIYVLLALLCAMVSFSDLRHRTIKNHHVGMIALLAIVIGSADYTLDSIWILGICWSALLVLHIFNVMGGGDVKLIAAFSLALPTAFLLPALMLVAVFGGVLTTFYLCKRWWITKKSVQEHVQIGLPYGVAICCGFFTALLLNSAV